MPDFDEQYERFMQEMSQHKQMQEATVHKVINSMMINEELEDGTNFYNKLLELKDAHQKTLVMWEKLYKEKGIESEELLTSTVNRSQLASLENLLNSEVHGGIREPSSLQSSRVKDRVRDMSSVHPFSVTCQQPEREQLKSAGLHRSAERLERVSDSCRSSMSDDFAERDANADEQNEAETSSQTHIDTRHSAMARIEDMWEKFSVDNYCCRSSQKGKPGMVRSSSLSKLSSKSKNQVPQKKPVTVPKPFSMSLRKPNQTPKKSKAALELEQQENEKKKTEDLECQKKFKAMPVPAHVHLRLYDELKEARESRRREIVRQRKELLESMQEPFQLSLRDEEKQKCRPSTTRPRSSHQFRAHPFPSHLFSNYITDKMLEEEEYRKIRKNMRAKELMKSSSLPQTMKFKGKDYTDGRHRHHQYEEHAKRAGLTNEYKFQPRINRTMPDFDEQYERFMQEMSQHKQMREATVCKPFNLRTSTQSFGRSRSNKMSRSYADVSEDDDSLSDKQQMLKSYGRNMSSSASFTGSYSSCDVIPTKSTRASAVRASANRTHVQKERRQEAEERRKQEECRSRGLHLKKTIAEKSPNMDSTWLQQDIRRKLQAKKKAEHQQIQSYQQHLQEMKDRVNQRPLLFEQVAQRNAGRIADRKYMETLKKSGIDFDSLRQSSLEGSRAAGSIADSASDHDYMHGDDEVRSADASPGRSSRESTGRESPSQTLVASGSPSAPEYSQEYDDDGGSSVIEEELET